MMDQFQTGARKGYSWCWIELIAWRTRRWRGKLVIENRCCWILNGCRRGAIAPGLSHYAEQLSKIKGKLEKLELTQAWSLRETDLYDYMKALMKIDDERVNGKFVAQDGTAPEEGQSVSTPKLRGWAQADDGFQIILYLLRRSYAHVYTLMISSEV
jgi:hypothetical protein